MMMILAGTAMDLVELGDRWIHFFAGVLWIGLLYFFNWVNSAFAPTMDGETKKKVVPELMPRALWWFRWGAAYTWITGVLLMFMVYYAPSSGYYLLADGTKPELMDWLPAFAGLFIGFAVYDVLFKALAKQQALGTIIWGLIAVSFACYLSHYADFHFRGTIIHVAALFGTAMAANVWMRIWPAQRRIITAIKNGEAPAAADAGIAGMRSKHNTYMSISLLLFMVGTGQPAMAHWNPAATVSGVLVVSWVACYALYAKAKTVPGF